MIKDNMRTLQVVVGAQFGSEAKGHVVQRLTERALLQGGGVQVIRVAGPNAGHTGYDRTGQAWALRQVPVAAVVDGAITLGIAAGSEIDPDVLIDELDRLQKAGLLAGKVVWISEQATIIEPVHREEESAGRIVDKIGSTGKGIGAARAHRIWRNASLLKDYPLLIDTLATKYNCIIADVKAPAFMGQHTIIEGTQGYGLGLHAGFYPQCTSSNCRAGDFMAMAGIHAWEFGDVQVWAVARIYPIRVAGNSGPLKDETSWEVLGLPEERTTVTKKVRRVGGEDWGLVREAVMANGGSPVVRLAVTMLDQKIPSMRDRIVAADDNEVMDYIRYIEREVGAEVRLVTTGPNSATFI